MSVTQTKYYVGEIITIQRVIKVTLYPNTWISAQPIEF